MPSKEILSDVSKNCLHGEPLPKPLKIVWDAYDLDDDFIRNVVRLSLLTSLEPLNAGYGKEIANESEDIAANVGAHQSVFDRLGFFAIDVDGGFLAFDLENPRKDDPPVVWLDSEGQYRWLGNDLSEAIFRKAEDIDETDLAIAWLTEHGMPVADYGNFGSSTQFLPDMRNLQTRWLKSSPETLSLTVRGLGFANYIADVRQAFGEPTREGSGWVRYEENGLATRFGFNGEGKVSEITLMDTTVN